VCAALAVLQDCLPQAVPFVAVKEMMQVLNGKISDAVV
jgi:hypothetical protein